MIVSMNKDKKNNTNENKLLEKLAYLEEQLKCETDKRLALESTFRLYEAFSDRGEGNSKNLLQNNEEVFRSLIQNSADIITLVNDKGIISYTSSSVKDILGYNENELIGRSVFEFVHPDDLEFTQNEFKITLDKFGKGKKIECRFKNKRGDYVYLEAQGNNQLNNPSIKRYVINSRNISERKKSEEQLKASEEQKNKILSSITEAFLAIDTNWNLTYINKRANVLFNRYNKNILGKNFWETFPETEESSKKYYYALSKNKKTEFEYFYPRLQKWLKVKIYPSKNGLSIFYTDITEEKIRTTILEVEQNALIENNKRNKRLNEIIDDAIVQMETIIPGMTCSVSLVSKNGKTLTFFSGPSISEDFIEAMDGLEIMDNFASCPTAAYRNEIIITPNVHKDPKWIGFTDFALREDFVSCWSLPIVSSKNTVLATLAIYLKKETTPSKVDLSFFNKIRVILANLIEERYKEDEINKLSLIAKNTSKAVFITDLDQRITWINQAFTQMTGYQPEEVIGKKPIKLLEGKKSDPDTMRYLKRQMVDNKPFILNTIFHKKSGDFYWSRITGQPMYDEAGNVNQYFAIQEDTTARKLAKIDLQDSEKRYRALFHSNSQPMFIYDKATLRFTEVNESAVSTYGYSPDEFNNMVTSDLLEDHIKATYDPSKDKINYRNNILNSTEILTDLCVHKTKTGRLINVEVIRNEMIISGKASILVIINDVTKKMITERELIESNERFTLASKAVNEAIWDFNLKTNKILWADGMTHLFGYKNQKEYPTINTWQNFVHPDDYPAAKQNYDKTLNNPNIFYWNYEYRFLKKDRTYAYILDRAYIVRDTSGKAIRVIGAMQDITKQKNFEIQKFTLISETQEHERKRFSMELHDGLAQHLVALNLYLSQIEEDQIVDAETLKNCFDVLKMSMNQTRALCYSLTPPELDHGFILALQAMFERLKALKAFDVILNVQPLIADDDFKEADKYNLYRIIQEFVNNSIKHSGGDTIKCQVSKIKNNITIEVKDNGQGFDITKKSNSLGLRNIAQRAHIANIQYKLDSIIGEGTTLKIDVNPKLIS